MRQATASWCRILRQGLEVGGNVHCHSAERAFYTRGSCLCCLFCSGPDCATGSAFVVGLLIASADCTQGLSYVACWKWSYAGRGQCHSAEQAGLHCKPVLEMSSLPCCANVLCPLLFDLLIDTSAPKRPFAWSDVEGDAVFKSRSRVNRAKFTVGSLTCCRSQTAWCVVQACL